MSTVYDLAELAGIFRVTEKAVRGWIAAGLPVVEKGSQGGSRKRTRIDLEAATRWYFEENYERLELERARTRLADAQAIKTDMENAVRAEDLAEISVIASVVDDLVSNAKTNLLALARKVSAELEGMDVRQREAAIEQSIRESLEELAAYRPRSSAGAGHRSGNARPVQAAAGADGKRVGRRVPNPKPGGKRGTGKVAHRKG